MLRKTSKKRSAQAAPDERQEPFLGPTRSSGTMGVSRSPRERGASRLRAFVYRHRRAAASAVASVVLATLGWRGYYFLVHSTYFELKDVEVRGPLAHVRRSELLETALGARGNFLRLDLARIKREVEQVPWVKHASVRRLWPDRISIQVEERQVLARWGDGQLVDAAGELFPADYEGKLPMLVGPRGSEHELAQRLIEFQAVLALIGRAPAYIAVSDRNAWTVRLDNGTTVQLGRDLVSDRLKRFVANYEETVARVPGREIVVDMRYRSGFSLRVADRGRLPGNKERQGP